MSDGYASSPVVSSAVRALREFAARELDRDEARLLLGLWGHTSALTNDEIRAVLSRFPDVDHDDEEAPSRGIQPPVNAAGW